MEENDRKGFLVLMVMLSEAFKEDISIERSKIYFEFLKEYSLYQVSEAIKQLTKRSKYFPRIADITEIIDPKDGYQLVESDESKTLRLKHENKKILEYISNIARIIGKTKDITKQIPYKKL